MYGPQHQATAGIGEGDEYELRAGAEWVYDPVADAPTVEWRVTVFGLMGFGPNYASALALRRDIERPRVERLLAGGATHEQVCLILL